MTHFVDTLKLLSNVVALWGTQFSSGETTSPIFSRYMRIGLLGSSSLVQ